MLCPKLRRENSSRSNRNVDQNEVVRWIEVVLAGLVDDTEIAIFPGSGVWKNRVDLAHLEIDAVVIPQTDRKLRSCSSHTLNPSIA